MIQERTEIKIEAASDSPSAKFSLHEKNLVHVFKILRDNLYSDKMLAVIREYSTNAYDANVENGKADVPIEVTLPNYMEPTFKVRDFGKGLSMDDVFNVFSSYGESTKRESNELIGTLGMGSKSGFAYQKSFTVTSWHDGMKKIYQAYIDESEIGTIMLFHEEPSNEPTGVCVTVDVNNKDITQFVKTAQKFYRWFTPLPVFYGSKAVNDYIDQRYSKLEKKGDYYEIHRDQYGYDSMSKLTIRMGNVAYPVQSIDKIKNWWLDDYATYMVLDVPLGSVTFTTSRESLELNERTIATIEELVEKARIDVAKQYQAELDALPTMWEALCSVNELSNMARSCVIKNNSFTWNGIAMDESFMRNIPKKWLDGDKWRQYDRNGWRKEHKNILFIINDGGYPNSQKRDRMNAIHRKYKSQYGAILFLDMNYDMSNDWIAKNSEMGFSHVLMSSVMACDMPTRRKGAGHKAKQQIFKWNGSVSFPYSNCWTPCEEPDGVKYYVKINAFQPVDWKLKYLKAFVDHVKSVNDLKIDGLSIDNFEVYGVREDTKIDSSWVKLESVWDDVLVAIDTPEIIHAAAKCKLDYYLTNKWRGYSRLLTEGIDCPSLKAIFKKADELYETEDKYRNLYSTVNQYSQFDAWRKKVWDEVKIISDEFTEMSKETEKKWNFGVANNTMWSLAKISPDLFIETTNALAFYREQKEKNVCVGSL